MEEIELLKQRIAELEAQFRNHRHTNLDAPIIDFDTLGIPSQLQQAPLGSVGAPSGGLTVDSEARSAINSLISRLEDLGLINPN